MSEQYGGAGDPQRPLPPRPPAPPASSDGVTAADGEGQTQQVPVQPEAGDRHAQTPPPSNQPFYGSTHQDSAPGVAAPPAYGPASGSSSYSGSGYGQAPYGPDYRPAAAPPARRFGTGTLVTGMLLAGLLGGGTAVAANYWLDDDSAPQSTGQAQTVVVNNEDSVNAVTAAAVKASPSVVTIDVAASGSSGTGSGIILDDDGHILTNTHVVTLGGTVADPTIEVQANDGRVFTATIVGTDPVSDLAVIKVDADDITPATLGNSDDLNVGDTVIAIGAPLGLAGTVTDGIVSTLNRTISVQSSAAPESESDGSGEDDGFGFRFAPPDGSSQEQSAASSSIYLDVIQTDAAINHGNSGGALVNTDGDVIGVNVAIASASEESGSIGVGFAVPMSYAERVADEIIETGSATHGFLGVSVTPATASSSSTFTVGAEVAENPAGGTPAARAGLKQGDVITAVNGIPVTDAQSLTAAIRMQAAGSKVTVDYTRGGDTDSVDVTLGDSADQ
ncbi:trypsin-like peptidase domain-containing protein [Arthrobacter sp. zg-Y820]|uniref:S1C family serine protease n=1 Tax=unclassified Arthrobacter TaxID=235627 RepID=UPI001E288358|nr:MULTISPECIES: trypsin-like peptidase domain-containing protein [unclassified Arthrobacter]MCC9195958.1 trypsin-like peptidase domain-containing protein [Arthrobacter sp. zg-Y820]MDK1278817.1 trypsin-like peptidase domain-containing protein [Arthrobacter sp. zg.Y820]WIB08766.1 trypsin-like peptidase domain-containing protein [Arthrobacter sp. zg-Y820]